MTDGRQARELRRLLAVQMPGARPFTVVPAFMAPRCSAALIEDALRDE